MIIHLPTPRLLPATILALSLLLGVKSVSLVRAAVGEVAPAAPAAVPAPKPPAADATAAPAPAPESPLAPPPTLSSAPAVAPPPAAEPVIPDAERKLLLDLRERRKTLDAREATVAAREATLEAAERKLGDRVAELQALQKKLEALEADRKQREDASWLGLVKVYEAMRPRDAATIFNGLDLPVLLQVVDRMNDRKAAPILAAMQPDKARDLTTKLAAMRLRRDTPATGG
jgi:flagellar motility protein MotE (MotC chaperone)